MENYIQYQKTILNQDMTETDSVNTDEICFLCIQNEVTENNEENSEMCLQAIHRYFNVSSKSTSENENIVSSNQADAFVQYFSVNLCTYCAFLIQTICNLIGQPGHSKVLLTNKLQMLFVILTNSDQVASELNEIMPNCFNFDELLLIENWRRHTKQKCSMKIKQLISSSLGKVRKTGNEVLYKIKTTPTKMDSGSDNVFVEISDSEYSDVETILCDDEDYVVAVTLDEDSVKACLRALDIHYKNTSKKIQAKPILHRRHSSILQSKCEKCGNIFKNRQEKFYHKEVVHRRKYVTCQHCHKVFKAPYILLKHVEKCRQRQVLREENSFKKQQTANMKASRKQTKAVKFVRFDIPTFH